MGESSHRAVAYRIVVIGSGNVATHLAQGFARSGHRIVQVLSRTIDHAWWLAEKLPSCTAIDDIASLTLSADLYLIATTDSAIPEIVASMPKLAGIVAHTSGSVPMSVLYPASDRVAVLYPLQTFSRTAELDLSDVPFFTEASDPDTYMMIDTLARQLSPRVAHADSRQRTVLHIAGVMSCNFVNYLWRLAARVLGAEGYSFDVVRPLIEQTLDKAATIGPDAAQTGPAARGDMATIEKHLAMLPPEMAGIYQKISQAIIDHRITS